jgi:hypothetical protein
MLVRRSVLAGTAEKSRCFIPAVLPIQSPDIGFVLSPIVVDIGVQRRGVAVVGFGVGR